MKRPPLPKLEKEKWKLVIATFVLSGSVLLHGQGPADLTTLKELSLEQIINIQVPTVYGASKHAQKITAAPSAVTIITRDEIRTYGHRTLADVLRSARDFYVTNDRNYSYVGVRGFNRPGDYGGRVLVLIDDHRLNDPVYESIGVGNEFPIDVDLIERVEIIRGPGSSLYGTNAFFMAPMRSLPSSMSLPARRTASTVPRHRHRMAPSIRQGRDSATGKLSRMAHPSC
jgi:hypothetical protein